MRLPTIPDIHINAFNGGSITELESGIFNGVIEKKGNTLYLTQRPSMDIFEDASEHVSDVKGRGVFYWDETSSIYIVNDGTLYKDSQASSLSTAVSSGSRRCTFLVLGTTLILIDPENDEAFTISNVGTVAEITDVDFPPKQTPAIPLAYGGAVLDNYIFVLGTDGVIYNSDITSATAWSALGFLEAEREPDPGVYLGKHHDNLVALGSATIEFFYDAANLTGSPLSRRQDVSHNIGCSSGQSVWETGDKIFFVGANSSGALGVYLLQQFMPTKISTTTIDSFLSQAIVKDSYCAIGSGLSAQGHNYYFLTLCQEFAGVVNPSITLVYDDTVGVWYEWEITAGGHTKFPLIAWSKRAGATERYGSGILSNGDLISINDNFNPQDTVLASSFVLTGFVLDGFVTYAGESGTAITLKSRLGMFDGGTHNHKYPTYLRAVASLTDATQTLTIRWADEKNSFNTGRTTDMSKFRKLSQLGRYRRRNHELEYSGTEQVQIEAIETDPVMGSN